jgi:hypothetical protein
MCFLCKAERHGPHPDRVSDPGLQIAEGIEVDDKRVQAAGN